MSFNKILSSVLFATVSVFFISSSPSFSMAPDEEMCEKTPSVNMTKETVETEEDVLTEEEILSYLEHANESIAKVSGVIDTLRVIESKNEDDLSDLRHQQTMFSDNFLDTINIFSDVDNTATPTFPREPQNAGEFSTYLSLENTNQHKAFIQEHLTEKMGKTMSTWESIRKQIATCEKIKTANEQNLEEMNKRLEGMIAMKEKLEQMLSTQQNPK